MSLSQSRSGRGEGELWLGLVSLKVIKALQIHREGDVLQKNGKNAQFYKSLLGLHPLLMLGKVLGSDQNLTAIPGPAEDQVLCLTTLLS